MSVSTAGSKIEGGHLFWCPGCDEAHQFLANPGPWGYDGNAESPTIEGSVLVRGPQRSVPGSGSEAVCHSFITAGRIEFLNDCTHPLSGTTVDLPDFRAAMLGKNQ
jgi:hypothetical protein